MNWNVAWALIGGCLASVSLRAADDLLPEWRDDKERAEWQESGWIPGWDLLGNDFPVLENQPPLAPMEWIAPAASDMLEEAGTAEIVDEKWADAYFGARPKTFLVDPQGLFTPKERQKIERLLEEHAAESATNLRVFVFDGKQEIPSDWREEEQAERLFGEDRPTVMLTYYHGLPHRAAISLVPSLAKKISVTEQHRTMESCVVQSQSKIEPAEQLEAFLQQLSIRVYWMGHTCGLEQATETGTVSTETNQVAPHAAKDGKKLLSKIPPWVMPMLDPLVAAWRWIAGGLAAIVATILGVVISWQFGKRRFPELPVEPRLGGPHAAGIGAMISFASITLPPAAQRGRIPDLPKRD